MSETVAGRVQGAIALLGDDPHPPSARGLAGTAPAARAGWTPAIIYTVAGGVLLVVVVTPGPRRDVYCR